MDRTARPTLARGVDPDLEQLQQDFLGNSAPPAARVARKKPPTVTFKAKEAEPATAAAPAKKLSIFAAQRLKMQQSSAAGAAGHRVPDVEEISQSVVGSAIVERIPETTSVFAASQVHAGGYPAVMHRSEGDPGQAPPPAATKKRSLFARQRATPPSNLSTDQLAALFPARADMSAEDREMHAKNLQAMAQMTDTDIEQAKSQLLQQFGPGVVDMLRRKAAAKYAPPGDASSSSSANPASPNEAEDLRLLHDKYYPNEVIEYDKLAWTGLTDDTEPVPSAAPQGAAPEETPSQRFDFNGNIVRGAFVPIHLGLHHHGDEPDQAGYTLAEILHLMRSKWPGQRSLSLKMLSAIVRHLYQGVYSAAEATDIAQELASQRSWVPVRMAVDDSNATVIADAIETVYTLLGLGTEHETASRQLERALIMREYGERFCAPVYSSIQHRGLPPVEQSTIDVHNELFNTDVVCGLAATDLLERCRYILDSCQSITRTQVLSILLRVARHSATLCLKMNTPAFVSLFDRLLARQATDIAEAATAFEIISLIAQSSPQAAQTFAQSSIVTQAIRTIASATLFPDESAPDMPNVELFVHAVQFLRVLNASGVEHGTLLDLHVFAMKRVGQCAEVIKSTQHTAVAASVVTMLVNLFIAALEHSKSQQVLSQHTGFLRCLRTHLFEDAPVWTLLTESGAFVLLSSILRFANLLVTSSTADTVFTPDDHTWMQALLDFACSRGVSQVLAAQLMARSTAGSTSATGFAFPGVLAQPATSVADNALLSLGDLCSMLMAAQRLGSVLQPAYAARLIREQLWPLREQFLSLTRCSGRSAVLLHAVTPLLSLMATTADIPSANPVQVYVLALQSCLLAVGAPYSQAPLVDQLFRSVLHEPGMVSRVQRELGVSVFPSLVNGWHSAYGDLLPAPSAASQLYTSWLSTSAYLLPHAWLLAPLRDLSQVQSADLSRYVATTLSFFLLVCECERTSRQRLSADCSLNDIAPVFLDEHSPFLDDSIGAFLHAAIIALAGREGRSDASAGVLGSDVGAETLVQRYMEESFNNPLFQLYLLCVLMHPQTPPDRHVAVVEKLRTDNVLGQLDCRLSIVTDASNLCRLWNDTATPNEQVAALWFDILLAGDVPHSHDTLAYWLAVTKVAQHWFSSSPARLPVRHRKIVQTLLSRHDPSNSTPTAAERVLRDILTCDIGPEGTFARPQAALFETRRSQLV
ncbi:hypothetical protein RI367_005787 [Sorochytrium milnesiophthora]